MLYIIPSILGYIFTFLLLSVFFTNPAFANTQTTVYVLEHSNEFTVFLCLMTLALGSWLGVKLPNSDQELSSGMKFVSGLFGGIMAFIYCLHRDKGLTLLNPIWVGISAVCLPATIMLIISKVQKYVRNYGEGS